MRKRMTAFLFASALLLLLCAGCSQPSATALPGEYPMELLFASGVGAWGTRLELNADGSFEGLYHDSDMGDDGPGYPNGTAYMCSFAGNFLPPEQLDEYSFRLQLDALTLARPAGEEWIEDGIRYFSAGPHGLHDCSSFVFYTPDTPIAGLDEEFLSWWPGRYLPDPPDTLNCYGLWNTETGSGFFTYSEELL